MRKYGVENFTFEILEKTSLKEETIEREQYYINKYRSYIGFEDCNGYNATLGGDGKCYADVNEEEIISYYDSSFAPLLSDVAERFNISIDIAKSILDRNNRTWIKDKATLGKYISYMNNCGIFMVDVDTKEIVECFFNIKEACNYIGKKNCASLIYSAINENNRHKTAYGYEWYNGFNIPKEILEEDIAKLLKKNK